MFIDTHAHLNFKDFNNSYAQIIERANAFGVGKIIVVGSNFESSIKAIEIAKKYPNVYASVGLHPTHIGDEVFDEEKYLKLAKDKKVVAIGETGLDYYYTGGITRFSRQTGSYYDKTNATEQQVVFEKLIKIANITSKPLILHARDAGDDLISVLMGQHILPKAVMHCFSENWQFAKTVLDMGLLLSFTGVITFSKNQDTFEVIREVPLEKIMIETDCPYLAPEPHRGKQNEPAFVIEVAKKIAEIKKISLEKVEAQTSKTAEDFFKI